jgi:hypothetical protein
MSTVEEHGQGPEFGPYYLAVAATLEKAGELAAGVESWLVGSPPPGVFEQADEYDSSVRLRLATVAFGSDIEERIARHFQVSTNLRTAYRAGSEVIRLLTIMDASPEIRAPFAVPGDALATQARLAPPPNQRVTGTIQGDNERRGRETELAAQEALRALPRNTMPGTEFAVRRIQRACLLFLAIAGTQFAQSIVVRGETVGGEDSL